MESETVLSHKVKFYFRDNNVIVITFDSPEIEIKKLTTGLALMEKMEKVIDTNY